MGKLRHLLEPQDGRGEDSVAEAIKALSTCLAQRQCPISFIADTGSEMRGARKTLAVKICGVPFVKMVIIPFLLPYLHLGELGWESPLSSRLSELQGLCLERTWAGLLAGRLEESGRAD